VVLERVGLASLVALDTTFLRWAMWALVGLSCLAVVMNLASPSPLERLIWVPVSVALAVLCLIVARSAPAA
jgi:predicted membrane channel-forming protein YqfA (hemolysin III family)